MSGIPDFPLGETVDFKFTTRQFSDGVPTTLAGTPAIEIYEDNSITQITAGITLTVDFDGITGLNNLRVVATGANGFGSGQSYAAVISAGTVGGTSVVGEVVLQFTIERSPALRPTTVGRTLDVTATGEAGIDWANIGSPAAVVDLAGTDINLCDTVTTLTGHTAQTGDSFARLGAPAGASVSADIAAVEAQTDDIGVAGAGLTAIPWNAAWDAEVESECADALVAIDLDHLTNTAVAIPAVTAGTFIDQMRDDGTATFDRTTDSLQAIRDTAPLGTAMRGTDSAALASVCTEARLAELDAANIPSDVDAVLADTGTDGVVVNAAGLAADAVTEIRSLVSGTADAGGSTTTMVDAARTEADDVWNGAWILFTSGAVANQTRLITNFDAVTDTTTFAPAATASIGAGITYEILPAGAVDVQSWLATVTAHVAPNALIAGRVDADAQAGLAPLGTAMRGTDSAALASVCTEARLAELDAANLPTDVANVQSDTDDIQTRLPAALVAGRMDSDVGAMQAGTVTAAAVATGAVDADAVATDAVNEIADGIRARQLTEGYAADGVAPTLEQMLFQIWSAIGDFSVSGTTLTCRQLDGTTTSMTFTLDDATNPTDRTRAT